MPIRRQRMQLTTPGMDPDLARALTEIQRNFDQLQTDVSSLRDGRLYGHISSTAAPTWGTNAIGDFVRNSAPADVAGLLLIGWVCTASGTPGTWVECWVST